MRLPTRISDIPLRLATGAFILNSGLSKRGADEETARGMHGMAAGTYPFLKDVDPTTFVKALSAGEIALGTALLVPLVPSRLAGAGLAAFGAGLVGLYLRTPGLRRPGTLLPTQEGTPIAKDSWLVGAGLALLIGDCGGDRRR
ncbi:hypothetical protein ACOQFV_25560 [Nocardiopsis changdeensis]|uniref:DoxX family membrane protein n=1 Tax=Nocardiopsis changdeensis TaxID=2831969 RepID=A0ABX8BFV6_9ACTN|nr:MULTISPECIES: hypothetical protein [Nocardiopsis]QUX21121.1 hypothetical protein KGD84_22095 [Nocardiopsis changdeensis]QYX37050.1 hypothetical protein K1J57_31550 [Nocardiopsis sp. MT53]